MGENRAFFLYLRPKNVQHVSESRVKKKNIAFLSFLVVWAIALSACLFDSDDSALSSWLKDQGLPDSYNVQTLTVDGLAPVTAKAYRGNMVFNAYDRSVFGTQAGLTHDIVFDIAFTDPEFFDEFSDADSAAAFILFYVLTPFYTADAFPSDSLPYEESLDLKVEWKLDKGKGKGFVDSISKINLSMWQSDLKEWKADNSADTTVEITIASKKDLKKMEETPELRVHMPSALIKEMKELNSACRLQLRLSAPEAKHLYRFYGTSIVSFWPLFRMRTVSDSSFKDVTPFRINNVVTYNDSCDDCLLLHGGTFDSIVVEYPSEKILEALSDFYGDAFPFDKGDGNDVRQAVVLAQLTMPRDDSEGYSELGLPIQVVVGSYLDSLGTEVRTMEKYKVNRKQVAEVGHPNMVFYDGDSLSLQVTYGLRDIINQAKDGRNFKMMVRLGYPILQANDSLYENHEVKDSITGTKDTSYVFFDHFDYARYDFGTTFSQPATLKLWLATKRGGEE